jgi:hypothetical protein
VTTRVAFHPEDLLFDNRWIVTHVLPATDDRIDFEVFARAVRPDEVLRPRLHYGVFNTRAGADSAGYATRQPLSVGMTIVVGVENCLIREIRRGSSDLLDGYLVVETLE